MPYAHVAMIDAAHGNGTLVLAGALKPTGALLVFRADSAAVAEAFARQDPYVLNGLVSDWRVREWTVVASSKGHRLPRADADEEETVGEHLVIDGLEEAAHDQMLEARREELEQEGEIL